MAEEIRLEMELTKLLEEATRNNSLSSYKIRKEKLGGKGASKSC